jgi:hypothetical protein
MKAFKGTFKKKNHDLREMIYIPLDQLPSGFLATKISGSDIKKEYDEGMELVWDLEVDNFRIFNHATQVGELEEMLIDDDIMGYF